MTVSHGCVGRYEETSCSVDLDRTIVGEISWVLVHPMVMRSIDPGKLAAEQARGV